MKKLRNIFILLLVVVMVLSMACAFLHQHHGHESLSDCQICQFILLSVFLVAGILLLFGRVQKGKLFSAAKIDFVSTILGSSLRSRAPPVLF